MGGVVYRDSLGAWQGLSEAGGLELDGRDEDLGMQLKNQLDLDAESLEAALAATSTAVFLQALFQVIQPFASMFRDVLGFFEKAGARQGQTQWKVSLEDVTGTGIPACGSRALRVGHYWSSRERGRMEGRVSGQVPHQLGSVHRHSTRQAGKGRVQARRPARAISG